MKTWRLKAFPLNKCHNWYEIWIQKLGCTAIPNHFESLVINSTIIIIVPILDMNKLNLRNEAVYWLTQLVVIKLELKPDFFLQPLTLSTVIAYISIEKLIVSIPNFPVGM